MVVISISVPKEILEFLKTQDNRSKYIVRLIRKDMTEPPKDTPTSVEELFGF